MSISTGVPKILGPQIKARLGPMTDLDLTPRYSHIFEIIDTLIAYSLTLCLRLKSARSEFGPLDKS